jgi:hypothetical protein
VYACFIQDSTSLASGILAQANAPTKHPGGLTMALEVRARARATAVVTNAAMMSVHSRLQAGLSSGFALGARVPMTWYVRAPCVFQEHARVQSACRHSAGHAN